MNIIISIMLFVFSFALFVVFKSMMKSNPEYTLHTTAKINSVEPTSHGILIYVKFENEDGEIVQGVSDVIHSAKTYHLGDEVECDYYYTDNDAIKFIRTTYDRDARIRLCDPGVRSHWVFRYEKFLGIIFLAGSIFMFISALNILF
ncbi:MAG: hypothetical protein PHD70_14070 [Anaerostipes sp.]|nr:hypothetical protein [Lachnospiraceae bacterium]MDD3747584.1 hypothetical protein [Anaerostipes sp.]